MNVVNATSPLRFSSSVYRGVTYIREVVENVDGVIGLPGGVYNFGSETTKSIYELTRGFLELIGKDIPLEDAHLGRNLWMNCTKARLHGVDFSSAEDAIKRCALDYGYIKM